MRLISRHKLLIGAKIRNWLTKNGRYFQSDSFSSKRKAINRFIKIRAILGEPQPYIHPTRITRKPTPIKKTTRKNNTSDKTTRRSLFPLSILPRRIFSSLFLSIFFFLFFLLFFVWFYHPTNRNSAAR